MAWRIKIVRSAEKALAKIGRVQSKRILAFLTERISLSDNPRSSGTALSGKLSGLWRYRVGDYRIICSNRDDELLVLVVEISHRSDVYR